MRWLTALLVVALLALQFNLWFGKGGVRQVQDLRAAVEEQKARNDALEARNRALQAEVEDLREGSEAIEERARSELGLIKPDETFYQVVVPPPPE